MASRIACRCSLLLSSGAAMPLNSFFVKSSSCRQASWLAAGCGAPAVLHGAEAAVVRA
jgi:hypothetical protein